MAGLSKLLLFGQSSKSVFPKLALTRSICYTKSTTALTATNSQLIAKQLNNLLFKQIRNSHGRQFNLRPGMFYTKKFWDIIHLYLCVALIPIGIFVLYNNIFIGPAELAEIPEGYEPRYWEYVKDPARRWFQKNFYIAPEKAYELSLHNLYEEQCNYKMRRLSKKVRELMSEREDYKAWYYNPVTSETSEIASDFNEKDILRGRPDVDGVKK